MSSNIFINFEESNEISSGFTIPENYTCDADPNKQEKEGIVKVFNEDGLLFAELIYEHNMLNGYSTFFNDGEVTEKIMYKNDVADGWSYTVKNGKEDIGYMYENGKKTKKLSRLGTSTFWKEEEIDNENNIRFYQLDDHLRITGKCLVIVDDEMSKVVEYEEGKEVHICKTFTEGKMMEFDQNDNLIYEGDYTISILQYCPRNGVGKEYRNDKIVFDGNWSYNKPNGVGTLYSDSGDVIYKGDWGNGLLAIGNDQVYDYESKRTVSMKYTIHNYEEFQAIDHNIPILVIPDNCCNEKQMKNFILTKFPNLRSVEVGNQCCNKVIETDIIEMDNLVSVKLGCDSFKKYGNILIIQECPRLEEIKMGAKSFGASNGLHLEELPCLKRVEFGTENDRHCGNFAACGFSFKSLPSLEYLFFGNSAFAVGEEYNISNCPSLKEIHLCEGAASGNPQASVLIMINLPELKTVIGKKGSLLVSSPFYNVRGVAVINVPNLETLILPNAFSKHLCVSKKLSDASKFEELEYGCCTIMYLVCWNEI